MVSYEVKFTKPAIKDVSKLKSVGLSEKARNLIDLMKNNPYQNPPPYEKLVGDLKGLYSRRINHQHRLVYEVLDDIKVVKILSMWSHYE